MMLIFVSYELYVMYLQLYYVITNLCRMFIKYLFVTPVNDGEKKVCVNDIGNQFLIPGFQERIHRWESRMRSSDVLDADAYF